MSSQLARVAIVRAGYELALVAAGNEPDVAARVATERARNALSAIDVCADERRQRRTIATALKMAALPCYGSCRVPSAQFVADAAHVIGRALRIYDRTSARLAALHARAEHGVDHVSEDHGAGAVRHGAQPGSGPVARKSGGAIRRATVPIGSLKEGGNAE